MSEPQFPALFGPRNLAETQNSIAYSSPFGKDSMFYTPKVVNIAHSFTALDSADYKCQFAYFKSGADLLERYNLIKENGYDPSSTKIIDKDDALKIDANSLIVMYEDHTEVTDTLNFYGTACRVIIGENTQTFIGKLVSNYADFFLDELFFGQSDLSTFVEGIVNEENEKNKQLKSKIDPTIVELAILLEYHKIKKKNTLEGILEGFTDVLRNKTVDGLAYTVEMIESLKLTAANYEPAHKNYSPLLPVGVIKQSVSSLNEVADILGNVLFTVAEAVQYVFPAFKSSIEVLNDLHQRLRNFIEKITHLVAQGADMANAFVCGLCNGFYSLVQSILALLGFVMEKITFNTFGDLVMKSPVERAVEKVSDYQIWAEFVEDYVELAIDAVPVLFDKLVDGIAYIITNIETVWDFITGAVGKGVDMALEALDKAVGKLAAKTKYWWAFVLGAVAFEVIVEVVLAIFTGGTSVIAKASAKITRVINKTTSAVAKAGAKTIDIAAAALKAIRKFFAEMIEALKNGKFIEWLNDTLNLMFLRLSKKILVGNNWEYTNLAGNKFYWRNLKWPKEIKSNIQATLKKIEKKRLTGKLKEEDLDEEYEALVANELIEVNKLKGNKTYKLTDYQSKILEAEGKNRKQTGAEIDIADEKYIFECKRRFESRNAPQDLRDQLIKYYNIYEPNFINADLKEIVVIIENGEKHINNPIIKKLQETGITIIFGKHNIKNFFN